MTSLYSLSQSISLWLFIWVNRLFIGISLAAVALVSWFWWHSEFVHADMVEVTSSGKHIRITSNRDGYDAWLVRDWSWKECGELRVTSAYDEAQIEKYAFLSCGDRSIAELPFNVEVRSGRDQAWTLYAADGDQDQIIEGNYPVRVSSKFHTPEEMLQDGFRWSVALQTVSVKTIPHHVAIGFFAIIALVSMALHFVGCRVRRRGQLKK